MTLRREPLYASLLASSGTWLALCAAVLFLMMMGMLVGPFQACDADFGRGESTRVGLWLPASTPAEAGENARRAWQENLGDAFEWSVSDSLAELASAPVDVVLVPHARRLGSGERIALGRHLAGGGGAVVVGGVGVRDAKGAWLGWDATRRLLGVRAVTPLAREQSFFVAAGERGPLTAGLDPGQRFALSAEDGAPALAGDDGPLLWSTYAIAPVGPAARAMLARERGAGRLVWLATGPEYAADGAAVQGLATLGRAALAWAGRLPLAEVAPWPDGARFAALLALDTEDAFPNAAAVAAIARREDLPITFLAVSDEAKRHPEVTAELVRAGEVGSHADRHEGFEGEPAERQRERLARARRELEALGAPPLRGFRPPLLSYDATTLEASVAEHYDYVLANHGFDRLAPSLAPIGNGRGPLVQIARSVRDDVDLIERDGVRTPEALASEALRDAREVAERGGLYYLSFHTQLLATPDRIAALPAIARGLREEGAWLARGAELADWWRARAALSVELERIGPRRLLLHVANTGDAEVERGFVRVHLQHPVSRAELKQVDALRAIREQWGAGAPELHHAAGAESLGVALPPIPAGTRIAWHLDWWSEAR